MTPRLKSIKDKQSQDMERERALRPPWKLLDLVTTEAASRWYR